MTTVIGDGDRDGLPYAFGAAPLPVLPALVAGNEGGAGDAGRGERHARDDEEERAPAAADIGAQAVEEMGGGQEHRIPNDERTSGVTEGKGEYPPQLVGIMDPDAQEMRQMDTKGRCPRGEEAVARVEQENRMLPSDRG